MKTYFAAILILSVSAVMALADGSKVGVYLATNGTLRLEKVELASHPIFTDADIVVYHWTNHTFQLTEEAAKRIPSTREVSTEGYSDQRNNELMKKALFDAGKLKKSTCPSSRHETRSRHELIAGLGADPHAGGTLRHALVFDRLSPCKGSRDSCVGTKTSPNSFHARSL